MYSAKMMRTAKLGIFHVLAGKRAYSSGNFASHTKKKTNNAQESKNGARNPAFFQPYDAPRVRPRMRRMIPDNMDNEPTKSSRFHLPWTSAMEPLGLGIQKMEPIATGMMRIPRIRKNHLQGEPWPWVGMYSMNPAMMIPVTESEHTVLCK